MRRNLVTNLRNQNTISFVLDWMTMAAVGQARFSEDMKVDNTSQDKILQPDPPVQEGETHEIQEEIKETNAMGTCSDGEHVHGQSRETTLPMGYKMIPKRGEDIVLNAHRTLTFLESNNPILWSQVLDMWSIRHESETCLIQYQLVQNVSVNGLKEILENACKLLRKGNQNSHQLSAYLFVLNVCCMTSAVVRRAVSFPGMVPLFKDFINNYLIGFIGTPFDEAGPLVNLAGSLAAILNMVEKFMAFSTSSQSDDLLPWWKTIDELCLDRSSAICNDKLKDNVNTFDGLEIVSVMVISVSQTMKMMQATDPPPPCNIMKLLDPRGYNAVFCSSLQCPVFVEEDGVLLHCARCKPAPYCSRRCQRAHWKQGHREKCWKITWDLNVVL